MATLCLDKKQLKEVKRELEDHHFPDGYVISSQISHHIEGAWPVRYEFITNKWPEWTVLKVTRDAPREMTMSAHWAPGVMLYHRNDVDLTEFLQNKNCFDWTQVHRFQGVTRRAWGIIQEVAKDFGTCVMGGDGDTLHCTMTRFKHHQLPSGLEVCKLTLDDRDVIETQEKYKMNNNFGYVDESMAMLINNPETTPHISVRPTPGTGARGDTTPGTGARVDTTPGTGARVDTTPGTGATGDTNALAKKYPQEGMKVGWIFTTSYGSIGYLQVKDSYRGRGIAKYLISAMTRTRLEKGLSCIAHIRATNTASIRAMQACGYYKVEGASGCWASYYPRDHKNVK